MLTLNNLARLVKKRKVIGRGGSRGGTSGRGHKGQKARTGTMHGRVAFEGGQMPLFRRLPKRGFNNADFQSDVEIVNLQQLNDFFENGAHIDRAALLEKGILKNKSSVNGKRTLKVLGKGNLTKKITIVADACSKSAAQAIEKQGGKVQIAKES
ncbi:MAG TPA: 50S ribosomal protein L15 [Candidatus Limnocylindria bacterium]|nr:50S ribosomal protein L15 [Candidatus Limnocylindria bacterium]